MSPSKLIETKRSPDEKPIIDTGKLEKIPFFSVCIPTHNRANFLPQTIESVLAQELTDFELIICDNASTDNTQEVVKKYQDKRIRYVRYNNLVNMYANHNRCIDLSLGDWILFVHSDDYLTNTQVFKNIYQVLPSLQKDFFLVTGRSNVLQSWITKQINPLKSYYSVSKETGLIDILISNFGLTPSGSAYRKSYLINNQFDEQGGTAEVFTADRTMTIMALLTNQKICVLPENLINKTYYASESYRASFNCNWHIGLARTMKLVIHSPEWPEAEILLANKLKSYGKSSLDILIRLAYANEWETFWRLIKVFPKLYLINFRIIHILTIMFLGQRLYIYLLIFYRRKYLYIAKDH